MVRCSSRFSHLPFNYQRLSPPLYIAARTIVAAVVVAPTEWDYWPNIRAEGCEFVSSCHTMPILTPQA